MNHVWHPQTKRQLDAFASQPSHAIMVVAPAGSGKFTAAALLARRLLELPETADILAHHQVKAPKPLDQPVIPIEFIRELRDFVKLKSVAGHRVNRIILLPDAERMQVAAQNALLKLLEEPPEDTVIILTVQSERALLPTVTSRTQLFRLSNPTAAELKAHFAGKGHDGGDIERMYMLSGGRVGLMSALLEQNAEHPLAGGVLLAKELLQAKTYDRLTKVEELSKDKEKLSALLEAMEQVIRAALGQSAKANKDPAVKRLHSTLVAVNDAREALKQNVQGKLILTNLFLNM